VHSRQTAVELASPQELLHAYLQNKLGVERERSSAITRRPVGACAPLSLSQEPIFWRAQEPDLPLLYNESVTVHRAGPLDGALLVRVLTEIVRRHEIWRTNFQVVDGKPRQVVQESGAIHVPSHDLCDFPVPVRDAEAIRLGEQDSQRRFDLQRGPLVRFRLVKLAEQEYRLFVTMHQIICDGVSLFRILLTELCTLYDAFGQGNPSPLPELAVQYADYAYWQRLALDAELSRQMDFWRTELSGKLPVLCWPARSRPAKQSFRGRIEPFALTRDVSDKIRAASINQRVTLFTTLLTAVCAVLHAYTGQQQMILGTVSASGRKHSEVAGVIGYFLNPVCLRMDLAGNPSICELLQRACERLSVAISNDDVALETLAENTSANNDPSRHPFFTCAVSLEPPVAKVNGWTLTPMDLQTGGARWDVYIVFDDRPDGIIGRLQYNTDLLKANDTSQFIRDIAATLSAISSTATQHLSGICQHIPHTASV
jgi:condensation domain-containing protein